MADTKFSKEFEDFWYYYPTRYIRTSGLYVKLNKQKAWLVWKGMNDNDRKLARQAISRLPKTAEWIPDAFRWLRDSRWLDYQMPRKQPTMASDAKSTVNPATSTPKTVKEIIEQRQKEYEEGMARERARILKEHEKGDKCEQ